MVGLFGGILNQAEIISLKSKYLKSLKDTYRVNLEKNPNYQQHFVTP